MRQLIQAGTTLPLGFLQVVRSGLWVWGAEWELPFQMGSFAVIPAREKTAFSPFQGQTPPGGPGLRSHLPFASEANRLLPEGSGGRCAGGGACPPEGLALRCHRLRHRQPPRLHRPAACLFKTLLGPPSGSPACVVRSCLPSSPWRRGSDSLLQSRQ